MTDCHCFAVDFIYKIASTLSLGAGAVLAKIVNSFIAKPILWVPSTLITPGLECSRSITDTQNEDRIRQQKRNAEDLEREIYESVRGWEE